MLCLISCVGKTTLVSLLTRFYDPTEGRILLDGVDLADRWPRSHAARPPARHAASSCRGPATRRTRWPRPRPTGTTP
ncbi:MAG TPA: ATP-binding cassette domain-containing protein [Euzebyales bacterium]|nr:ATP-binding cassette domain-containing protein [Euzebyales bacterium]